MRVSVIIPSYNRKAATRRAVQSVLAQSYEDLEVLVVDDGSREGEVFEPDPQWQPRVRVIRHPSNRGVAAARNTGVQQAAGPLIAFLDSDDLWLPGVLARHVAQYRSSARAEQTLVYGAYLTVDGRAQTTTPPAGKRPAQRMSDYLFIECGCLHVNTWLAAKALLESVLFDPALRQSEDWDALLRMEAAGVSFSYDPEPGAARHVDLRQDRLTTRTDFEMQWRFLSMNAQRMTPQARAIFRGLTLEQQQPSGSRLHWALRRLKVLMSAAELPWHRRVALVCAYIAARIANRVSLLRTRRIIDLPSIA